MIYARMLEVLSSRFSSADRQAVIEILRATKKDLPREFNGRGGPASSKEAAAKRKPDRAQPSNKRWARRGVGGPASSNEAAKRRTEATWTVGPTLKVRSKTCTFPNVDGKIQRKTARDCVQGENMNKIASFVLAWSLPVAFAAPALAHHSAAAYDTQKEVTVTGTVSQYRFGNPHIYMTLQVKRADGSTGAVEVEAGAASVLNGLG